MVLTSLALAVSVSVWLVPPYLGLMAWILLPARDRRGDALRPTGQAVPRPKVAEEIAGGSTGIADAVDVAPADPPVEPPSSAESLADQAEPADPPALKTKRGRGRGRKAKGVVDPPAGVTWVQVGPGKYVRVETASPTAAPPSQTPEAEPTAEDREPTAPTPAEECPEDQLPPTPGTETAVAVEAPLEPTVEPVEPSVEAEPVVVESGPACAEVSPPHAPEAEPIVVEPGPACAEVLPSHAFEAERDDTPEPAAPEASGFHHDEPHEVDRVAENVQEELPARVEPAAVLVEDDLLPAVDRTDGGLAGQGEVSEKLGIAPEASDALPDASLDVAPTVEPMEETRLEPESGAPRDPSARSHGGTLLATFRGAWSPPHPASWLATGASPSRRAPRNQRQARPAPGLRQRSRRSAGRLPQACRTFPPRAPPRPVRNAT
jgi:hypothetical protein